jgi:hypothetical protein
VGCCAMCGHRRPEAGAMITGVPSTPGLRPRGRRSRETVPSDSWCPLVLRRPNRTEGRQSALLALRALEVQSYWYGAGR